MELKYRGKKKNWRRKIEDKDLNFPIERLFMNIFFLWKSVLYTVIYLLEKKKREDNEDS